MTIDYHKAVCWFIDRILAPAFLALFLWAIGYTFWWSLGLI